MLEQAISKVTVDFSRRLGPIKPMNAGNNGPKVPTGDQTSGNFDTFQMLHIPYARLHDANLARAYGAPHTVDVWAIFKDFNADPEDPASYDFMMTDIYLKAIVAAGTEPYFRLGGSIEHYERKHLTCVPPDFNKFAVICEHIIRHCTGDWANGLNLKITYWEIWNEPDLDGDDSANKRCWQGTAAEFREMFCITFKHLKQCFPELKIGGPASCAAINNWRGDHWTDKLFEEIQKQNLKLDFYSWHCYSPEVSDIFDCVKTVRDYLDSHGQPQAESILNEWNYVKGWTDEWVYSLEQEAGMKGAAFALCAMLGCQKLPLDILMYYDMRVDCCMNGLWKTSSFERQKPWFAYFMFDKLAQLGTEVESESDDKDVQLLGATNEKERKAVVIGSFSDEGNFAFRKLEITLKGLSEDEKANLTVRLLDERNDLVEIPFKLNGNVISFNWHFRLCSGLLIQC